MTVRAVGGDRFVFPVLMTFGAFQFFVFALAFETCGGMLEDRRLKTIRRMTAGTGLLYFSPIYLECKLSSVFIFVTAFACGFDLFVPAFPVTLGAFNRFMLSGKFE